MTTVAACTLVTALWDIWNQRLIQFSLRFWSSFHKCPDGALSALLLFIHQSYLSLWSMDYSTQASLSLTISQSLLKLMSIELMMPSNHLILCYPLLLLPSIFPTSGSFSVSWLFTSGGQSIGASALASVLPINIQGWLPLGLTGLISFLS